MWWILTRKIKESQCHILQKALVECDGALWNLTEEKNAPITCRPVGFKYTVLFYWKLLQQVTVTVILNLDSKLLTMIHNVTVESHLLDIFQAQTKAPTKIKCHSLMPRQQPESPEAFLPLPSGGEQVHSKEIGWQPWLHWKTPKPTPERNGFQGLFSSVAVSGSFALVSTYQHLFAIAASAGAAGVSVAYPTHFWKGFYAHKLPKDVSCHSKVTGHTSWELALSAKAHGELWSLQ